MQRATVSARATLDPSEPQSLVLFALVERGPLSMSQLSGISGQTHANTSYLVTKLTRSGLVKRQRDENDRRRSYVCATADAQQLVRRMEREHVRSFDAALAKVPPSLVGQLDHALGAVLNAMTPRQG